MPEILQVAGRAHPLFLHFPIVFFILFIGWLWLAPKKNFQSPDSSENISRWLLLITAFTASITALMGIFLSRESAYNQDALEWHRWSGTLVSIVTFLWYIFFDQLKRKIFSLVITSVISFVILLVAGDQGASITHGDNFLLAPIEKDKNRPKPSIDQAFVFADMVKPILDTKCLNCHNSKKAKGELIMETAQALMKGGKDGALWDTTNVNMSLILQRIHLPESEKKHMPPIGKPQLTEEEEAILYNWIRHGANFKLKVIDLEPTDTLRTLAETIFKSAADEDNYDFTAVSEKTIQKLNSNFRSVHPIAINSPAIAVDFFGAAFFNSDQLKDLQEIRKQLVSLNLDKMPVTDNDLQIIGQFENLRDLNLSFTKITGTGLSYLEKLHHLRNLSVTNTSVKKEDIEKLKTLKEIRNIFVWNTGINIADAEWLNMKYPSLGIRMGMRTDTMFIKLNAPIIQNDYPIITDTPIHLLLKHYIPGITIRYTLDGTDPDSTHSTIYNNNTYVSKQSLMKARAFKPGWQESDVVEYRFYQSTYKPDTVIMLKPADSNYMGKGGQTLNDLIKGSLNFRDGKWIAFRKNGMESLLKFTKSVEVQNVTISSLVNVGALIFPPKTIRIMGGSNPKHLKLLAQMHPKEDTLMQSRYLVPYECKFTPTKLKYIKVEVETIGHLPKQFIQPSDLKDKKPKKKEQDMGWFFTDEIFVN